MITEAKQSVAVRPFQPGVNYRNGKLYVFTKKEVTVIRPWPAPAAWKKTVSRPYWRAGRPELNLALVPCWNTSHPPQLPANLTLERFTAGYHAREQAEAKFAASVPVAVRQAVLTYNREVHWQILCLCAYVPGALDLIASNPLLAYCLAVNRRFHQPASRQPMRAARCWIRRPQRHALAWLGFPGTQAVAKLTRKVCPAAVQPRFCFFLRCAMHDPQVCRLLAHLPRITSVTIRAVSARTLRSLLTTPLLREMDDDVNQLRLLYYVARRIEFSENRSCFLRLRSLAELRRAHDKLVGDVNELYVPAFEFPPPPLPGCQSTATSITPITTPQELCSHAQQQHNCVRSYASYVARGDVYFYQLTTAEEICTVALRQARDGAWELDEIAATGNLPASAMSRQIVAEWLQTNGQSLGTFLSVASGYQLLDAAIHG